MSLKPLKMLSFSRMKPAKPTKTKSGAKICKAIKNVRAGLAYPSASEDAET
jgi:hypothetical protein